MEIYCPKCTWEPGPHSRWMCHCGHHWNAFETQGRCPQCHFRWQHTQCHACAEWSPHVDWYHDLPEIDLEAMLEEVAEAKQAEPQQRLRGTGHP
ncbi:hypothetical protein SAMN05421823_102682 [Catalinimonas alkaloidigena]|uniref:Uncharacterized protein n=1 Tax=Catalinimonas alkaloidigena TaxID=1075417 RepID=A0A1G9BQ89_9BACT|nr:hypothetical protein [Catalinimonas alkaloidigena]SDK41671.1 hypothetical protein SAMN05421823_102682 [Catalinimonas alkaloidigena]